MTATAPLLRAIERNLRHMHAHEHWHAGTTSEPERVRLARGNPPFWRMWAADSTEEAARAAEHLIRRGMRPDPEQGEPGPYIYLF
jgi:hypothetical protein